MENGIKFFPIEQPPTPLQLRVLRPDSFSVEASNS
jgi:hypothetical protein